MTPPPDTEPKKKRLSLSSLMHYILLNEDTWRCLSGIVLAVISAPYLLPFDRTGIGRYIMFISVVVVGWALSKAPSRWIVGHIRRLLPKR